MAARRLDAFYRRRAGAPGGPGAAVHRALARATVGARWAGPARRRASLCHDGTPVVYSLKLRPGEGDPEFRMLVEPGGLSTGVPAQARMAMDTAGALLARLGWHEGAEELRLVAERVIPADTACMDGWRGGVWLGLSSGAGQADVRVYHNLRHGGPLERWQRFADVLACFGDRRIAAPLQALLGRVPPHAVPVGLAAVVAGRLQGVRLYAGMDAPSSAGVLAACTLPPAAAAPVGGFCDAFAARFGAFPRQSVTLGFDFARDAAGVFHPRVARTKVDLSCQWLGAAAHADLLPFVRERLAACGASAAAFDAWTADLEACFGGYALEYLSLGADDGVAHLTVYARPAGMARA